MLRQALEHLAASAEAQESYLRELGTWPSLDELALELDDVAQASEASATPELRQTVQRLDQKLNEMSGERNAPLWEPQALDGSEWAEVRQLAAEALAALGGHS
jgi:hypothetical protein